jgi:hypothetical protein
MVKPQLYDFVMSLGAAVTVLENPERQHLERRWLHAFCGSVKDKTGKWIYRGYRWHAFSYGYEEAKTGLKALACYKSLRPRRFYVFSDWGPEIGLACEGIAPPDLSELSSDLYVFPSSLLWTMFFTHEQPDLGPFFACTDWVTLEKKRSQSE